MSNREPGSNVISLETNAAARLDEDQETPDAVCEFDQTLTAILMVFGMVASPKTGESPAVANLLFACGTLLTEAFHNAVALYREAVREELEAEIGVLERDRDALQDEINRQDDIGRQFAALCEAVNDYLPLGCLPVRLQLEFEALAERLGVARSWRVSA